MCQSCDQHQWPRHADTPCRVETALIRVFWEGTQEMLGLPPYQTDSRLPRSIIDAWYEMGERFSLTPECQVFLHCAEKATTIVPNPVLGDVPSCASCAAGAGLHTETENN